MRFCLIFACLSVCLSPILSQPGAHPDSLLNHIERLMSARSFNEIADTVESFNIAVDRDGVERDSTYGKINLRAAQSSIQIQQNGLARQFYLEALSVFVESPKLWPGQLLQCYLGLGVVDKRESELDSAILKYQMARDIAIDHYGSKDRRLHNIYNNLGNVNRLQGRFDDAIRNHELALEIRKIHYPESFRVGDSYNNIALIYHDLKRFGKAKIYFQEALNYYKSDSPALRYRSALAEYNIARIYYDLGKYAESQRYLENALAVLIAQNRFRDINYWEMLNLSTNLYVHLGDFKAADSLLELTIEGKSTFLDSTHLHWNYTYTSGAIVKAANGQNQESMNFLNQSIRVLNHHYHSNHPELIALLDSKIGLAIKMNRLSQAEQWIMQSNELIASQRDPFLRQEQLIRKYYRQAQWHRKAFLNSDQNDDRELESSVAMIDTMLDLSDELQRSGIAQQIQLIMADEQTERADFAVRTYLDAYQLFGDDQIKSKLVETIDSKKGKALKTSLRRSSQLENAMLPKNLREQLQEIRGAITTLRTSIIKDENDIGDLELLNELQSEYNAVINKIVEDYPEYGQVIFGPGALDKNEVAKEIDRHQIKVLEYEMLNDQIICLELGADGVVNVHNWLIQPSLLNDIRKLHGSLAGVAGFDHIDSLITAVSKQVLPEGMEIDDRGLLIIPDGLLFTIPFEILKIQGSYLIKKTPISYAYSLQMWSQQNEYNHRRSRLSFTGYAPDYEVDFLGSDPEQKLYAELLRSEIQKLPSALAATQDIGKQLGGKVYLGDEATKKNFVDHLQDASVLHLSMHAVSDSDNPWQSGFLFQPEDTTTQHVLSALDLIGMKSAASLAVLSACNTGWGQIDATEGMKSLGYAFTYAGVKSNVMSLWQVPDYATGQIMRSFFEHLQDGKSKHEALRQAKLQFLNNTKLDRQNHPFYWAGFVLNGNIEPIDFSQSLRFSHQLLLLFGVISIILIGRFWVLRRKR